MCENRTSIVSAIRDHVAERSVIDWEIVVAGPDGLDFDALSERIHPAGSRVEMLARTCLVVSWASTYRLWATST